jgi:flagellar biosynthesis protein FliR
MTFPFPSSAQIEAFILVLLRVSAIVVLMPVFWGQGRTGADQGRHVLAHRFF